MGRHGPELKRRHTGLFEFRGACFEVEPDFVVELVIESNAATGILQTIDPFSERQTRRDSPMPYA